MEKYYTFSELKESKLIYDRKPPAFGIIMTLLTLIFVVGALFWAGFSTKTYVVKASALVDNENKTNIMNSVSGKVKSINVIEGQQVEDGDVILVIDSFETELQIAQIQAMVDLYDSKIKSTQRLVNFVFDYSLSDETTHINPFNSSASETAKLYSDAETFINYVAQQKAQVEITGEEYSQEQLDEVKTQFLTQQYTFSSLEEYSGQKAQQESQLRMYQDSLSAYTVKALQGGIIHLSSVLTEGTVLQAGTLLGNISGEDKDNLYFNAIVSATERSKLSVGSQVEIAVSGAMQTEYGTLNGEIVSIDNDVTQTEDGQAYYRVKIKSDSNELCDKHGRVVQLKLGMVGECRIKYDETTYLNWMIEQIVGKLH